MASIDRYLAVMTQISASDLHLCSGVRPTYRVHGVMKPTSSEKTQPTPAEEVERLLGEIMPERNRQEFEAKKDTDFAYEIVESGGSGSTPFSTAPGSARFSGTFLNRC